MLDVSHVLQAYVVAFGAEYDTDTSALALYVNLCKETKKYLDKKRAGSGVADARKKLLSFYNHLPVAEEFERVTRACFKELTDRTRNQRKKDSKAEEMAVFKESFASLGGPPPPPDVPLASAPSSGASGLFEGAEALTRGGGPSPMTQEDPLFYEEESPIRRGGRFGGTSTPSTSQRGRGRGSGSGA